MKIFFMFGLIALCINVFRFLLGNYSIIKNKSISIYMKIWNAFESIVICVVLILLIIKYYN